MVVVRLVGIARPGMAESIADAGNRLAGVEIHTVAAGGLVALLAPADWRERFCLFGRRRALEAIVVSERVLEDAARLGPILPARPGTLLADKAEAVALLLDHGPRLARALAAHGNDAQYQVTITWDPQATLAAQRGHPALAAAEAAAAAGAVTQAGSIIQSFMAAHKAALGGEILARLRGIAKDIIALPVDHVDMLANVAVLVGPGGVPQLEQTLAELDGELAGNNRIRLIGPLPPASFAAISIERPNPQRVAAARRVLGVEAEMGPEDLRRAYLTVVRASHPDVAGDAADSDGLGAATAAFRLLARVSEIPRRSGACRLLLVDIGRPDEFRPAAA
jgi:hypothetical protein